MPIDKGILKRYSEGKTNAAENALIAEWFEQYQADSADNFKEENFAHHLKSLDKRIYRDNTYRLKNWSWSMAASAILLAVLSISLLLYKLKDNKPAISSIEEVMAPSASNTLVILENNKSYNLDDLLIGDTIRADGYFITKLTTGELHYINASNSTKRIYNTLRTKSGGIAHVKLSDGSLVWLNANSEIKYPIDFGNDAREVELKGEGYFEIMPAYAKEGKVPFFVRGEKQTIQVLGTKFNANFSYRNETTLLEGLVKIADEGSLLEEKKELNYVAQLRPNQVYKNQRVLHTARVEQYIDWKEGYFDLGKESLADLAYELSNWYGVPILVNNESKNAQLFGRISRQKSLKEVLDLIAEATPIQYELKNQHIIITNK